MTSRGDTGPVRSVILCAPDHAGTLNQALGVAEAFSRLVQPDRGRLLRLRRFRPIDPAMLSLRRGLGRAVPNVVVSCGASGERKARRLKRADPDLFWVHIERLKGSGAAPDLNAIPAHDWNESAVSQSAMRIVGVPHRVNAADLALRRDAARHVLGAGTNRMDVVLIGGPNEAFAYDEAALQKIVAALEAAPGARCLLVTSRRTPSAIRNRLAATRRPSTRFLDEVPSLDYIDALAAADRLFVTEDSISMSCEAVSTGRPVFRIPLTPQKGDRLTKFRRHQAIWAPFLLPLDAAGRQMMHDVTPPDDALDIARRMVAMLRTRA